MRILARVQKCERRSYLEVQSSPGKTLKIRDLDMRLLTNGCRSLGDALYATILRLDRSPCLSPLISFVSLDVFRENFSTYDRSCGGTNQPKKRKLARISHPNYLHTCLPSGRLSYMPTCDSQYHTVGRSSIPN